MELADYLRILRNHWIAVTAFVLVAAIQWLRRMRR
jgi:hypothetical protein